jgi:hypothetical protein
LARLNQQPTNAPVGPSVHRMRGCVFFIWFLTLHCTTVNLFWLLTLTFFYPPTPIELHPSPNKQSPYSPYLLVLSTHPADPAAAWPFYFN